MDRGKDGFIELSDDISGTDLSSPSPVSVLKIIWHSVRGFFKERPGRILLSSLMVLMLWGHHGALELLTLVCPGWRGPGVDIGKRPSLIPGIPWDNELISFWGGAFLCVVVPMLIIKFLFRQSWSEYGLGLPPKGKRRLAGWSFLILTAVAFPLFWMGARDPAMIREYPIFRPFADGTSFLLYELAYLPFFITIEFIFRGYILFGLAACRVAGGVAVKRGSDIFFGRYALLIALLPYIAWHLGKPIPELWGAIVWGLAAGSLAYACRSIWPVVFSHWLLNVFMDAIIANPF